MEKEISEEERKGRYEALKEVRDGVVKLKESPFFAARVRPVIGEGSHFAKVMFIGEAPGKNESETGRPFCGAAGRVLDELLNSISLPRQEVYITNVVKDRPPGNRDPLPEEILLYAPFLDKQIEIIKPKVIVTLGRFSMMYIMERYGLSEMVDQISALHGKVFEAAMAYGVVKIIPMYHPAVAVYNRNYLAALLEDFKVIKNELNIQP